VLAAAVTLFNSFFSARITRAWESVASVAVLVTVVLLALAALYVERRLTITLADNRRLTDEKSRLEANLAATASRRTDEEATLLTRIEAKLDVIVGRIDDAQSAAGTGITVNQPMRRLRARLWPRRRQR